MKSISGCPEGEAVGSTFDEQGWIEPSFFLWPSWPGWLPAAHYIDAAAAARPSKQAAGTCRGL